MDQPSDPAVPRLRDTTARPDLWHGSSRAGPARKGYRPAGGLRGKLARPPDTGQAAYQRAGYVRARRAADSARSPW